MASPLGVPMADVNKVTYPHVSPSFPDEDTLERVHTEDTEDFISASNGHTQNDHKDMMRMGKNQELAVR